MTVLPHPTPACWEAVSPPPGGPSPSSQDRGKWPRHPLQHSEEGWAWPQRQAWEVLADSPAGPPPARPLKAWPGQLALGALRATPTSRDSETYQPEPGRRRRVFSQLPLFLDPAPTRDPVSGVTMQSSARAFHDCFHSYTRKGLFP